MSAVSFRNTKICALIMVDLSASRGRIQAISLSMFLETPKYNASGDIWWVNYLRWSPNINSPMKTSALLENVVPVTVAGQHLHLLPLNGGVGGEPKCTSIPAATGAQPITELYHFWGSTNEKAIDFYCLLNRMQYNWAGLLQPASRNANLWCGWNHLTIENAATVTQLVQSHMLEISQ